MDPCVPHTQMRVADRSCDADGGRVDVKPRGGSQIIPTKKN